jgi:hypothetical protein
MTSKTEHIYADGLLWKYYSRKEAILAVTYNIHFPPSPAILKVKLKQCRYRPGVAQSVPGS